MDVDGCPVPDDRRYDLEHDVWYRAEPSGDATVGITSLLASFAGRFQALSFRDVDGVLDRGRSVATVESIRLTGAVRLPVRGRVVARNPELPGRPRLLNDAPYDRGWVVRIVPDDPDEAARTLPTAEAARAALAERIRELHVRCFPATPDAELYEIGAECSAILARLDEEVARRAPEEVVLLVTDDPTSPIELVRWSDRTGHAVLHHRAEGNLHQFLIRREADPRPRRR